MRILHICNNYGSMVHSNLYQGLDKFESTHQIVYTPRDRGVDRRNAFDSVKVRFIHSPVLKTYHRGLFHSKIKCILQDVKTKVDLREIDCVHASTLLSDGAVAYRLKKEYGIPYIVAVRNTDINFYIKYCPHLWLLARKILTEASRVVFITPALYNKFWDHIALRHLKEKLSGKCIIQPNGIDPYILSNISKNRDQNHSIAYVGIFDSNKNVIRLIKAVLSLKHDIPDVKLNLVGGSGSQQKKVIRYVNQYPDVFSFKGKIHDKAELINFYRQHQVFAMASKTETFGLVYIEALSQNVPVLYSKNQAIDGLFDKNVGEAVNPYSVNSIKEGLYRLLTQAERYDYLSEEEIKIFDWSNIAQEYINIYNQATEKL